MVEAYRVGGHCEGMVVLAALRYSRGLEPVTAEVRSWMSTSLADTVEVLALALSQGVLDYGMGDPTVATRRRHLPPDVGLP